MRVSSTVREALEVLDQWEPDILVSDIGMPGEDGYEKISRVRERDSVRGGTLTAVRLLVMLVLKMPGARGTL